MLNLKIVSVDSYLATPVKGLDPTYSHFRNAVVHQVPVIRVFGITPTGEKGCLHIHGVFPYLYIPLKEGVKNVDGFMYHLTQSLDKQLNLVPNSKYDRQHVFKITPVKGIPIYGYHKSCRDFLKIYFYKPFNIKRAATLLLDGLILGESFQPHEAHIPYILQFFIDYNLYGMSFLNIEKYIVRAEEGASESSSHLTKVSLCQIEADALADDILNAVQSSESTLSNPGLVHIWEEERERRRQEELFSDPSIQQYDNLSGAYRSDNEMEQITQLRQALKERLKNKIRSKQISADDSLVLDSSFRESHCSGEIIQFDPQDFQSLNGFRENLNEELHSEQDIIAPDGDSILGSQRNQIDDEISSSDEDNIDLTQPLYISESENSEDEVVEIVNEDPVNVNNTSDKSESTVIWPDFKFLSENSSDSDNRKLITPKKGRRSNPTTPNRYTPLKVTIRKSPRNKKNDQIVEGSAEIVANSPKSKTFFEKFDLNSTLTKLQKKFNTPVSDIEDIVQVENGISSVKKPKLSSNSSNNTDESNGYRQLSARKSLNFGLSENENLRTQRKEEMISNNSSLQKNELNFEQEALNLTSFKSFSEVVNNKIGSKCYLTLLEPPSKNDVIKNMINFGIQPKSEKSLFYSNPKDDESLYKEVGNKIISVQSTLIKNLEEFKGIFHNYTGSLWNSLNSKDKVNNKIRYSNRTVAMYPLMKPPSRLEASAWLSSFNPTNEQLSNELSEDDEIIQCSDENFHGYHLSDVTINEGYVDNSQCERNFADEADTKNAEILPNPSPLLNRKSNSCVIEDSTPDETINKNDEGLKKNQPSSAHRYITLFSMELHIKTRGTYNPDPELDQIDALFYYITNDVPDDCETEKILIGVIMVTPEGEPNYSYNLNCNLITVSSEEDLLNKFIEIIHIHNPDIFVGYEIEMLSWTYLIQRGAVLKMNLLSKLSRIKPISDLPDFNAMNFEHYQLTIPGRIILNVWRLMRHEIALMSYTFENVVYHLLRRRVPHYSFKTLTEWWKNNFPDRLLTLKYYLTRVEGSVKLLEHVDFVGRTSELATLFGIQFYEVLSRGSQFRVESIMLRMAKAKNYVSVSPSIQQRGNMRAPGFLPLIMEPQSRFFEDPVIVLDFQSLYPSMIIAYNYCFTTCLGFQQYLIEKDDITFACTNLSIDPKEVYRFEGENLHISPAGAVFVNNSIRKGILPQMLEEILETRLMVKNSMKRHKNNKILYQIMDARQLGLKLIANVTYGYTSANFSGRMPSVEIADSVVSKGRETLQRAIRLVEKTKKWGAEVVYGDTDSLFVLCRGKTRQEAFEIGQEIADAVTLENPKPVKLKLEKVYHPCILQTKKRYAGFMYESPDQEKPEYDAKGIETVRRDGCPAASKILEKSLKILFESYDVSKVKSYVNNQLSKLISGKLYFQDLIFAKEYRGSHGYKPAACVPALKLAREWISKDKRSEPRVGERVGYVIIYGPPGVPLIQLVRSPYELLTNVSLKINTEYYITKAILPPLDRCFSLMGVNVFSWYKSLPKKHLARKNRQTDLGVKKATLSQYFSMENCIICNEITSSNICIKCQSSSQFLSTSLMSKINNYERRYNLLLKICSSCCDRTIENDCVSLDCPVFYNRVRAFIDYEDIPNLRKILEEQLPS